MREHVLISNACARHTCASMMRHVFHHVNSRFLLDRGVFGFLTVGSVSASSQWMTAHQDASGSSAVCDNIHSYTDLSFLPGNDLGLLFSRQRSISPLFKSPKGEETSGSAAISGEHIGVSAGLTVADKSCMINAHASARTHTHTRACWAVGGSPLLGEQQTSGWALIISHQTRFYKGFSGQAWKHGASLALRQRGL